MFKKMLMAALITAAAVSAQAGDIATVNGKGIPEQILNDAVKAVATKGIKDTPELRAQLKQTLILNEVLFQEAKDKNLDDTDDIKKQLDVMRRALAVRALRAKYIKDNPVTESDVKNAYDIYVKANTGRQYWLKHIVVKTEPEAQAVLARLKKGESFEDIANEKNFDATKGRGGDLGWQHPSTLIKPVVGAMEAMKIGQTSAAPVQGNGGYHILRLVNIRRAKAEPYDKVKDTIKRNLEARKWNSYVAGLVKKANISQ